MTSFLHCCATNDKNGNARRVFVLINPEGYFTAAWDEGCLGDHAVPSIWRKLAYNSARVKVTVKEYNRILKTLPSPKWASEIPGYEHLASQGA